jgi:hypothetical protein
MRPRSTDLRRWAGGGLAVALVVGAVGVRPAVADSRLAAVSTDVVEASEPTISTDGRWVVFAGLVGERRSVFRTDRETGATVELSPLPDGVRSGDTIHPRLSPDGCVVAAITEVPFDLFRDDDGGERWDVYRLVVPECGGVPNGWELVSASPRTGTAIDAVFVDSPPAVGGSGSVIAYVHQLAGAPEGVSTIEVVDLTVPINEPGRLQPVAGMPAEAPNRAYSYRGARQPALSQNGRHLAFVSDATSSEALPGWADGPAPGEQATAQVYVWDRQAPDQRRAVRLVSGRDGVPSAAGGEAPVMSESGRYVAFVSRDRTLVPAELPRCIPTCPAQVYRFDRDVDGNGIFDEPPRSTPLALVSAVDAGVVERGVPVAGDRSSWSPAISADGSQVAFVTDATNLLPSQRGGGGGPDDGDLIVAEIELGALRRVLDEPEATSVPGAHGRPALSGTGQVVVFETMAAAVIPGVSTVGGSGGVRTIVAKEFTPRLSLAALDFGSALPNLESAELYAKVLNAGPAAFEPTDVRVTSNFRITGGTCARGIIVAAGSSCSVYLVFRPTEVRGYSGTLTVSGRGAGSPSVSAEVRGAAGEPTLLADPGGVDLAPSVVGQVGGRVAIDIDNIAFLPTTVGRIALGGAHPDDFTIVTQSCTGRALNPDASCTVEVEFLPTGAGYRTALLVAVTPNGEYTTAVLGGYARYEPSFGTNAPVAQPGSEVGLGGSGFPADAPVTIGFDDGSPPFATITTDGTGSFLTGITLPTRVRLGERRLVASSSDGAVATFTLDVVARRRTAEPWLPGYGVL